MTRFVPYPLLAGFLFLLWLALGGSYSPGWSLLGILVAVGGSWIMAALRLDEPRMQNARAAARLAAVVSIDIIRSNIAVARILVQPGRKATSGFLAIPLEIEHPTALAILAMIVTSTPGTVWVSYDPDTRIMLLHILDLVDEDDWLRLIKGRYETMLMAVFQ